MPSRDLHSRSRSLSGWLLRRWSLAFVLILGGTAGLAFWESRRGVASGVERRPASVETNAETPIPPSTFALGGFAVLWAGLVAGLFFASTSWSLRRSLASLGHQARRIAWGRETVGRTSGVREIDEIADELGQVQARLFESEKLRSLGVLAAGLGHEIRNPLSYVHSALHGLKERVAAVEDAHLKSDLEALLAPCLEGTNRMREVLRTLKDFSRRPASRRERIEVAALLRDTAKVMGSEIAGLSLEWQLEDGLFVMGDGPALGQVFSNLFLNAAQASSGKGRLRVSTRTHGSEVEVCVDDDGPGISAAVAARIFDPLFTTKDGQGSGLGLPLALGLVEAHGGSLECLPSTQGAAFRVRLPIAASVRKAA